MGGLSAALAEIGVEVAEVHPLQGGDLSKVSRVVLQDGREVVAKSGPLVVREARMLAALERAGARVPRVLAVGGRGMLLEKLDKTASTNAGWADLGARLRRVHKARSTTYGWDEAYAFGKLAIDNTPLADWPQFWAERRLLSLQAELPAGMRPRLEALARRLPDILPARPRPALLHGDLWLGNILFSAGKAWLIDPACYYGHSEVDLAMLTLFGDLPATFWKRYKYLSPGWRERRAVYQLWPALVHLVLFGGDYRDLVEARLAALGV